VLDIAGYALPQGKEGSAICARQGGGNSRWMETRQHIANEPAAALLDEVGHRGRQGAKFPLTEARTAAGPAERSGYGGT